jgi:hypothetical protein
VQALIEVEIEQMVVKDAVQVCDAVKSAAGIFR